MLFCKPGRGSLIFFLSMIWLIDRVNRSCIHNFWSSFCVCIYYTQMPRRKLELREFAFLLWAHGPLSSFPGTFLYDLSILDPRCWFLLPKEHTETQAGGEDWLGPANTCSAVRSTSLPLGAFRHVPSVHPAESICLFLIVKSSMNSGQKDQVFIKDLGIFLKWKLSLVKQ